MTDGPEDLIVLERAESVGPRPDGGPHRLDLLQCPEIRFGLRANDATGPCKKFRIRGIGAMALTAGDRMRRHKPIELLAQMIPSRADHG